MELREDNPYAYSVQIVFEDGSSLLQRTPLNLNFQAEDIRHAVQVGDTLSDISGRYYKSSKWWWVIFDCNHLTNPLDLEVGKILIIPDLRRVKALLV